MSDDRGTPDIGDGTPLAPPVAPVTITQIAAVSQQGTDDAYVTLVALCSDGSIWRLQEFDPGNWEEISQPPVTALALARPA